MSKVILLQLTDLINAQIPMQRGGGADLSGRRYPAPRGPHFEEQECVACQLHEKKKKRNSLGWWQEPSTALGQYRPRVKSYVKREVMSNPLRQVPCGCHCGHDKAEVSVAIRKRACGGDEVR